MSGEKNDDTRIVRFPKDRSLIDVTSTVVVAPIANGSKESKAIG